MWVFFFFCSWPGVLNTTLCDNVCQWFAAGGWFSPGTPVSSTNKNDCHDITKILLKLALYTINLNFNNTFCIKTKVHLSAIGGCRQFWISRYGFLVSCSVNISESFACLSNWLAFIPDEGYSRSVVHTKLDIYLMKVIPETRRAH